MDNHKDLFDTSREKLNSLIESDNINAEINVENLKNIWVPGRIEIVGKHTDYAKGRSLVCAIDRGLAFSFHKRLDDLVRFVSCDYPGVPLVYYLNKFNESIEKEENNQGCGKYISAALEFLKNHKKWNLKGVDIAVKSNLPQNSGLSSSSALVCGITTILTECAGYDKSALLIDDFGKIESGNLVGTRGGSQDHAAIMHGKDAELSLFDYSNGTKLVKQISFDPNLVFAIGVSGVEACKTGNALQKYNRLATRPAEEKENLAFLETSVAVSSVCEGFEKKNWQLVKTGIKNSQDHAENKLGTTVEETEALPRLASVIPGFIGGTTFGAGFGGAVYCVVEKCHAETFIKAWQDAYQKQFPERASNSSFFLTKPSQGTHLL